MLRNTEIYAAEKAAAGSKTWQTGKPASSGCSCRFRKICYNIKKAEEKAGGTEWRKKRT